MNDNEQILAELRKISAWTEMLRKKEKWSLIFVAVFIPAVIIYGINAEKCVEKRIEDIRTPERQTWYDVDHNVRSGDIDKAIQIGEDLIAKNPLYYEGHQKLAVAYLTVGKLEKAREHYAEAYRLFPSEGNESLLRTINKRIKDNDPQPSVPPNPHSPSALGAGGR